MVGLLGRCNFALEELYQIVEEGLLGERRVGALRCRICALAASGALAKELRHLELSFHPAENVRLDQEICSSSLHKTSKLSVVFRSWLVVFAHFCQQVMQS